MVLNNAEKNLGGLSFSLKNENNEKSYNYYAKQNKSCVKKKYVKRSINIKIGWNPVKTSYFFVIFWISIYFFVFFCENVV